MNYKIVIDKYQEDIVHDKYPKLKHIPLASPAIYKGKEYEDVSFIIDFNEYISFISTSLCHHSDMRPLQPNEIRRVDCIGFDTVLDHSDDDDKAMLDFLVSIGGKVYDQGVDITSTFRVKL